MLTQKHVDQARGYDEVACEHLRFLPPQPFREQDMPDLVTLKSANTKRWANARLLRDFSPVAWHLVSPNAKERHQAVSAKTGVPWAAIAVIHERESAQDWTGSLAQGDPWNRVSVHVPAGRSPFRS
jgi:lysozyme family protein